MIKAQIFDISRGSFVDGPGIRTTFYFKGCNLRCKWCHNPESWDKRTQMLFYADKCLHCGLCERVCEHNALRDKEKCVACGRCAEVCPHRARVLMGKEYTVDELLAIAKEEEPFYYDDGGVTLSGGECLLQIDFAEEFLKALKENGISTAVDTALCVPRETLDRVLPYTDLFLVDLKALSPEIHKAFTGADNAVILRNIAYLSEKGARMWIRIPVVPECNGTMEEMGKMADFVNRLPVERVDLMPYHTFGINKGRALGLEMQRFSSVSEENLNEFMKLFQAAKGD